MKIKQLFILICFAGMTVTGCHSSVKVEPLSLSHEDEYIRKGSFIILADRRVFATMAFLNTCGYDDELPNYSMHLIRIKVRKMIENNLTGSPEKLQAWQNYYKARIMGAWQYVDFALSLNSDYPFKRIRPDKELNYAWTAWMLADFPMILNDFWITARLGQVWSECKPDYLTEVGKYDPDKMVRQMTFIWQYLRMQRADTYIIVHVPNPLNRHATASGARFENYFYSTDGPGSNVNLNVHEYLHTIVNQIVDKNYARFKTKLDKYYQAGKDASISQPYQELKAYTSECLVHALDYRIYVQQSSNPAIAKFIEAKVNTLTNNGYTLLKPFYESLAEFEKSTLDFEHYFPIMLDKLPEYPK